MAYLSRLGLWGPGTAFADFADFARRLKARGMGFLEMLALDLKSQGAYVARCLSFDGACFDDVACDLTPRDVSVYDECARLWLRAARLLDQGEGDGMVRWVTGRNGGIGRWFAPLASASPPRPPSPSSLQAWRCFYAAQSRFFRALLSSLKVPTLVADARKALAGVAEAGMPGGAGGSAPKAAAPQAVVIGLQSTGEAALLRAGVKPGDSAPGLASATRDILLALLRNQFPRTVGEKRRANMPDDDDEEEGRGRGGRGSGRGRGRSHSGVRGGRGGRGSDRREDDYFSGDSDIMIEDDDDVVEVGGPADTAAAAAAGVHDAANRTYGDDLAALIEEVEGAAWMPPNALDALVDELGGPGGSKPLLRGLGCAGSAAWVWAWRGPATLPFRPPARTPPPGHTPSHPHLPAQSTWLR